MKPMTDLGFNRFKTFTPATLAIKLFCHWGIYSYIAIWFAGHRFVVVVLKLFSASS